MNVVILEIRPPRLEVVSGEKDLLVVKVDVARAVSGARLVLTNKRPAAADLFDDDQAGVDQVESKPKDLARGRDAFIHELGFVLPDDADRGALIALGVHVENDKGRRISAEHTISVYIAAA